MEMKMYRKAFGVALMSAALLVGNVAAKAAETPDWLKQPLKKPLNELVIGVTQRLVGNSSYTSLYQDTFLATAKQLGVKVIYLDAQGDATRQAGEVQDLVSQQVDVLVVWPVQEKQIVPSLKAAHQAGIPILNANSRADASGDKYIAAFTGPDDYTQGRTAATLLVQAIGGKGNLVGLEGTPGNGTSIARQKGFLAVLKEHPDVKLLDDQSSDWDRAKSQNLMESYVTRFGNKIDGAFAADDNVGMGALTAVRAAVADGKLKEGAVKIVGVTLYASGYDAIQKGDYYGSVFQSPVDDANNAVKLAIQIAEGQEVPREQILDAPAIDRTNISKFLRPAF